jgi:hypothetical protein
VTKTGLVAECGRAALHARLMRWSERYFRVHLDLGSQMKNTRGPCRPTVTENGDPVNLHVQRDNTSAAKILDLFAKKARGSKKVTENIRDDIHFHTRRKKDAYNRLGERPTYFCCGNFVVVRGAGKVARTRLIIGVRNHHLAPALVAEVGPSVHAVPPRQRDRPTAALQKPPVVEARYPVGTCTTSDSSDETGSPSGSRVVAGGAAAATGDARRNRLPNIVQGRSRGADAVVVETLGNRWRSAKVRRNASAAARDRQPVLKAAAGAQSCSCEVRLRRACWRKERLRRLMRS